MGIPQDLNLACQYFFKAFQKGHCAAAHNYAVIKLRQCLEDNNFSYEMLLDVAEKFALSAKNGYGRDIYYYTVVQLLLDVSQFKPVLAKLESSLITKPHRLSKDLLSYLQGKTSVTTEDLLVFLFYPNPIEILKKHQESQNKTTEVLPSKGKNESTVENKVQHEQQSTQKALLRLQQEFSWFTDPKNRRKIDLNQFKKLMGDMSSTLEIDFEFYSSKGSNTRFHISDPASESGRQQHFAYHPMHRSGQKKDAEYDPKRMKSLQAHAAAVVKDNPILKELETKTKTPKFQKTN